MRALSGILAVLTCLVASGLAGELTIEWDRDLAFERDRKNYQRMLEEIVTTSHASVTGGLGIRTRRPPKIRVLSKAGYEDQFGAQASARRGAHYRDGSIHVNGGNRLDARFHGLMEHEMVHAVVDHDGRGYALPMWLNEGVAELFRWRRMDMRGLARNQIDELQRAREQGELTPFPSRSMSPFRYLHCYAIALFIEDKHGKKALRELVAGTLELLSFDKACKRVLRTELRFLEPAFVEWVKKQR